MLLEAGDYTLEAKATNFDPVQASLTISVGGTTVQDFALPLHTPVTYYVKPDGDDAKSGLDLDNAWATIDNGDRLGQLQPGDTILVHPGTYTVRDYGTDYFTAAYLLNSRGVTFNPVTYKADGPVLIDGLTVSGLKYGFHTEGPAHDLVIDGFEIAGCTMGVYAHNGASNIKVVNCLIHDMSYLDGMGSAGFWDTWGVSNNAFCNNVVYSTPYEFGDKGIYTEGSSNTEIYNNTFVGILHGVMAWGGSDLKITNNIITDAKGSGLWAGGGASMLNSYNLFHNNNQNYSNVAPGAGELAADPMFVDAAGYDYSLQGVSPAINVGIDVGLPFYGSAPDLGAYEYLGNITKLGDLKILSDGVPLRITVPKVCTASSSTFADGSYYIEDEDRTSGIKVVPGVAVPAVTPGERITLEGEMSTDANGERVINISSISSQAAGSEVTALGTANRSVSGIGASVSGLLVKMWGRVTFVAGDDSYIYMDDGSEINDGSGHTGVRVILSGLTNPVTKVLSVDQYVIITGLVGLARDGATTIPAIRPRGDADITTN